MPTAADPKPALEVGALPDEEVLAFPAALAQEAFYYLERLQPGVAPFNIAVRFYLDGALDARLIERALNSIVERHEILRTHFEEDDGELMQIVRPSAVLPFGYADISGLAEDAREAELVRLGLEEARKPFDLHQAPLIRALLVCLTPQEHVLHISVHHAVSDGWSIGVLAEEIVSFYDAFHRGENAPLPPLPVQYADFAVWQREFLTGPEVAGQLEYWKKTLRGASEPDLPTDRPRPAVKKWNGDIVSELLPVDLTDRLQGIARQNGATLYHVFLAAFNILLHRYTGATDLLIGTPVAARNRPELEPLIGVFINTVLLRTDLSGNPDFHQALQRVRDVALQAIANQDLPFESLVRALRPERDPGRNPLFQINFTHQRAFIKPIAKGGLKLSGIPSLSPGAIYDLHFFMVEREGVWRASCDFNTDLFDRDTALRLLGHFRTLLQGIAEAPARPIGELPLLTAEEARQLEAWSGTNTAYPCEATLGSLFIETARRQPEKTALIQGGRRIRYGELHARASWIAGRLQEKGIEAGAMVGLAAESSPEMIAGLLGIVMAGAAYVPLDADYPEERIRYLIGDAGIRVVLADAAGRKVAQGQACEVVSLDGLCGDSQPLEIQAAGLSALHPAYVLYTSGSTGEPKGVVVPHRAVVRLVRGADFMEFGPDEVFFQAAPLSFDASTLEIWGPLLNGGALVLPSSSSPDLEDIAAAVRDQGVTTLWLTAGLFQVMIDEHVDDLKGLRNLLAGGDVLPLPQVRRALECLPGTRLINGYGPTENTTFTTCHLISPRDVERPSIPIGRPIANTKVWILDREGRRVPVGISGELHAGGDGLALEYLGNPQLTAAKFVPNPVPGRAGERLYRTGDLARWCSDGAIEFLGRLDQQVKVRGFRIEPAEIETALLAHPDIGQCKVAVRGDGAGAKNLVAWIAPAPGAAVDRAVLKSYLAEKLPAFLRPDILVVVDTLPLTASGKIDARSLPSPEGESRTLSPPPETPTEKQLAAIWQELLEIPFAGKDDNFFDLGGHSLLGLRLISRMRGAFGFSLPLATLLRAPTIHLLAALIDGELAGRAHETDEAIIAPVQPEGDLPPFFCIHGGDGGVIFYRNLARHLTKDRPLLAIEAPALSAAGEIKVACVEDIAIHYLRLLKKRQPRGPYYLGGYSFGGVVAYEMAWLLAGEGERVAFLALFDTMSPTAPGSPYNFFERLAKFWNAQRDANFFEKLLRLGWRYAERMADRIHDRTGLFPTRANLPGQVHGDKRTTELCHAHLAAMRAYRPRPFPGRMTLFKTSAVDDIFEYPEDYGWGALAGELETVIVPGHHLTLFDLENVGVLGREVRRRLKPSRA